MHRASPSRCGLWHTWTFASWWVLPVEMKRACPYLRHSAVVWEVSAYLWIQITECRYCA